MSENTRFEEKEYAARFDIRVWRKLLSYTTGLFPTIGALVVFMVIVALVDGIFPQMTRYAIDRIVPELGSPSAARKIARFAAIFGALALAQGLNVFLFICIAGTVEVRVCHALRARAFAQLQTLSFSYYDRTPAGWIMARMTSDAQRLGDTIAWGIVDLVWGTMMMTVIIGFMIAMHWKLALVTLAFVPVLLAATFWFQRKILSAQRKARKANSVLSGLFNEGLQGARTSKTLVIESYNCREFAGQSLRLKGYALRAAKLSALFVPVVIMLAATGSAVALGAGGRLAISGALSFGTLVAFVNYAMMFFDPAREVSRVLSEFQAAQASAERLIGLIETKPEIVDVLDAVDSGSIVGEIEFNKVGFEYGDGVWVLRDFSLRIQAGQTLAVVGETGSGKSTLVNLLCRFYEPSEGEIRIDGAEYRGRTQHWLHRQLGYVLQAPQLFAGTVRENIRYGRLDATDAEVERAAREANAIGFIELLERGFDTLVGEGGALLSTGQRQLISIARALVADPRIMILDEATSSVDTESEALIQDAIDRLLAGRTSVVIAHRLSTIRNADRIIVLDGGKIVEDGDHEALMSARGRYWRLYTQQFLEESVSEAADAS